MANYYPGAMVFHFRVEIDGINSDGDQAAIHVQKVSGLSLDAGEKTFYEGGENTFAHKLPEPIKFGSLTLTRAMVSTQSELIVWVQDALQGFQFSPKNMRVVLLNDNHQPLETWTFVNCWPKKMGISDLNAQESTFMVETLEFNYQYFYRGEMPFGGNAGAVVRNIVSNAKNLFS